MKNALLVISILTVALALILAQRNMASQINYVDARPTTIDRIDSL
jgi:hypothetical protein